jgi:hypothetical protein
VTTDELIENEVLERIQDILDAVSVIPYQYPKCDHEHLAVAVSILTFVTLKCLDFGN